MIIHVIPGLRIMCTVHKAFSKLIGIGVFGPQQIFATHEWNNLDKSLREFKSLDKFNFNAIRNVTI